MIISKGGIIVTHEEFIARRVEAEKTGSFHVKQSVNECAARVREALENEMIQEGIEYRRSLRRKFGPDRAAVILRALADGDWEDDGDDGTDCA